jgi:hypothetical protein
MGELRSVEPSCLLIGVLCKNPDVLTKYMERVNEFGAPLFTSPVIPFDYTDYYTPTMGTPLFRRFYLYPPTFARERLPDVKLRTNQLEQEAARALDLGVERPLNLDPGYLSPSKLVLASTKDHAHRIYLRDGIHAEVTLYYQNKSYRSRPWTFPDYASDAYIRLFNEIRKYVF